jgi:hypothetical protein
MEYEFGRAPSSVSLPAIVKCSRVSSVVSPGLIMIQHISVLGVGPFRGSLFSLRPRGDAMNLVSSSDCWTPSGPAPSRPLTLAPFDCRGCTATESVRALFSFMIFLSLSSMQNHVFIRTHCIPDGEGPNRAQLKRYR